MSSIHPFTLHIMDRITTTWSATTPHTTTTTPHRPKPTKGRRTNPRHPFPTTTLTSSPAVTPTSSTTSQSTANSHDSFFLGSTDILGIIGGLVFVCVVVGVVVYFVCRRRRRKIKRTSQNTAPTAGDTVYLGRQSEIIEETFQPREGISMNNNKVTYTRDSEYMEITEVETGRHRTRDERELDGTNLTPVRISDYDLPASDTDKHYNEIPAVAIHSSHRGSFEHLQPARPKVTHSVSSKPISHVNNAYGLDTTTEEVTSPTTPTHKKAILPPVMSQPNCGLNPNSNSNSQANSVYILMKNSQPTDNSSAKGTFNNKTNLGPESYINIPRELASPRTDSGIDCNYVDPSSLDEKQSPFSPDEEDDGNYYMVPSSLRRDMPLQSSDLPNTTETGKDDTNRPRTYVGPDELEQRSPTDKDDLLRDYSNFDVFQQNGTSSLKNIDNDSNSSEEDTENVYEVPSELNRRSQNILVRARVRSAKAKKSQQNSPFSLKEIEANEKSSDDTENYINSPTSKSPKEPESLKERTDDDTGNYVNSWISQFPTESDSLEDVDDDTGNYVNNYVNSCQFSKSLDNSASSDKNNDTGNYVNSRVSNMSDTATEENEYHIPKEFSERMGNKDQEKPRLMNHPAVLPKPQKPYKTLASLESNSLQQCPIPTLSKGENPLNYHTLQNQEIKGKHQLVKSHSEKKSATDTPKNVHSAQTKAKKALLPPLVAKKPAMSPHTAKASAALGDCSSSSEEQGTKQDDLYMNSQEIRNNTLKESTHKPKNVPVYVNEIK